MGLNMSVFCLGNSNELQTEDSIDERTRLGFIAYKNSDLCCQT